MFPLPPPDTSKATPNPAIKLFKHAFDFAHAEIVPPASYQRIKVLLDKAGQITTSTFTKQLSDLASEPLDRLRAGTQFRLLMAGDAVAQKTSLPGASDATFRLIDFELELLGDKVANRGQ